jgi:hypothetical protein
VTEREGVADVSAFPDEDDFPVAVLDDVCLADGVELGEEVWPCDAEEEDGDGEGEAELVEGGPEDGEDTGGEEPEVALKTEPEGEEVEQLFERG